MDQFRGYTVAGMFVVNFVGGLAAFPEVLKHHNGLPYFSYADTIMPSFMFAAGFSYRLSALKRFAKLGAARAYGHFVVRSLALVLVSLVMYAAEDVDVKNWAQLDSEGIWKVVGGLLKANLWEVLAIIGVVQIVILPVIAASTRVRTAAWLGCAAVHLAISHWFNFSFVYGKPNWMDDFVGLRGQSAWDGGFFGVLGWAIPMLLGTIVYDIMASHSPGTAARRVLIYGIVLLAVGYALNCLATLYDTDKGSVALDRQRHRRLAGDSSACQRQGPIARVTSSHSSFHAAATHNHPAAQLLDDEQEDREPPVHALFVGLCHGPLCDFHRHLRHRPYRDRAFSYAGPESSGRVCHPSHGRGSRPRGRAQGFTALVRVDRAGGLFRDQLSVRSIP